MFDTKWINSQRLENRHWKSRFSFLVAFAGMLLTASTSMAQVIPCAIRWDAWYDPTSSSLTAQDSISPTQWQNRAPKHCVVNATASVRCIGTQKIIDDEIRSSVEIGGINCWAFDKYKDPSSLTTAWKLFQSSAIKDRINWTWITSLNLFGFDADRPKAIADLVAEMRQTNYQKVNVGQSKRPVLFILWMEHEFKTYFHDDYKNFKAMLTELADKAQSAGLDRPYVVILRGVPEKAADIAKNVGADAIGTYSIPLLPNTTGPFESLSRQTRAFWSKLVATRVPIVPTIMTGFDQRPAFAHPLEPHRKRSPKVFYSVATNNQLSNEVRDAMEFVRNNPTVPSRLLLVYAWNENAEGGGSLNETLGDPVGNRLRAFKQGVLPSN